MKALIIISSFLKKNIFPIFIILSTMTVALFFLVSAYGTYNFTVEMRDFYSSADMENSIYFMYAFDSTKESLSDDLNYYRSDIIKLDGFGEIIETFKTNATINGEYIYVSLYSDTVLNSFPLDVDEGRWLSEDANQLEAVVCGVNGTKIGDKIELVNGLQATIVGILHDSAYVLSSGNAGTYISANDLFTKQNNYALVNMAALSDDELSEINARNYINYHIKYAEGATESQKDELKQALNAYGRIKTYDDIILQTNIEINKQLREALPLPIFMLIITVILLLSITALAIKRCMKEHSIYYLLGCSKQRSVFLISFALSAVFAIPCIINIILAIDYPYVFRNNEAMYVGKDCIIPIIIFFVVILLITVFIPLIYFKKYSPLDFYRRNL